MCNTVHEFQARNGSQLTVVALYGVGGGYLLPVLLPRIYTNYKRSISRNSKVHETTTGNILMGSLGILTWNSPILRSKMRIGLNSKGERETNCLIHSFATNP